MSPRSKKEYFDVVHPQRVASKTIKCYDGPKTPRQTIYNLNLDAASES